MTKPRPSVFSSIASSTLLCALAGAFLAPALEGPRLAVEQGTVLRKVFVMTWDMELTDLSVTFDGESIQAGDEVSIEQDERQRIELVDTYRSVKDGRAVELVRRFETLESESKTDTTSTDGSELDEQSKTSALEGLEVLFRWDGDDESYAAEFVDDSGDGALLDELEQDADLAGFLPPGDVEVDGTWTVGKDAMGKLLSPGGNLHFVDEDGEEDENDDLAEQFEENLTGELRATYRGMREVDGRELASIELEGTFETEAELEDDENGVLGTASMTLELEGELLWDLAAGHAVSIRLAGPCEIEFQSSLGDGGHAFEQSLTFEGPFVLEGDITAEG
jgi:hypothetical protein